MKLLPSGGMLAALLLFCACEREGSNPLAPDTGPRPAIEIVDGKKVYRDPGEKLSLIVPDSFQAALDTTFETSLGPVKLDLFLLQAGSDTAFRPSVSVLTEPHPPGGSTAPRDIQPFIEDEFRKDFPDAEFQRNAVERFGNRDGLVLEYTATATGGGKRKFRQVLFFGPKEDLFVTWVDLPGAFDFNEPFEALYRSIAFE